MEENRPTSPLNRIGRHHEMSQSKRRLKRDLGFTGAKALLPSPAKVKRKLKRDLGYESDPMKLFRFINRLFR